jgi:hypothetical protein
LISFKLIGQELLSTGGTFYENSSGSLSYSIGEIVSETTSNNSSILTQGFQQSNLEESTINETINSNVIISPNPADNYLEIIGLDEKFFGDLLILDISGKIVFKQELNVESTGIIQINQLKPANYFVYLINLENEPIYLGKILKTNSK